MSAMAAGASAPGILRRFSNFLYRRPKLTLVLLLLPPMLWLGVVYLGSLAALLAQSMFSVDDFSGLTVYRPTLKTYGGLFTPGNWSGRARFVSCLSCTPLSSQPSSRACAL